MATLDITDDNLKRVLKSIKDLVKLDLLVGVPDENATRKDEPGETSGPFTNASIAYIAEMGSPIRNIPPRPFMKKGIESTSDRLVKFFVKAGQRAKAGDEEGMMKALNAAGLIAADGMKAAIQDGGFVPLAPRTLKARKARGRTGVKPLLDTGQLRNSISYVIRKRPTK